MLNYKDLYDGFKEILDKGGYTTQEEACQMWTSVFEKFYLNMVAPIPGAANSNLYSSLKMFQNRLLLAASSKQVIHLFEILVTNLHLGVCLGVNMTGIYTTIPPSSPLLLRSCFNFSFSSSQIANLLAFKIFTWVSSTFSTINVGGAVIKWI